MNSIPAAHDNEVPVSDHGPFTPNTDEEPVQGRAEVMSAPREQLECAARPSVAAAVKAIDGSWEACWSEPDGHGTSARKFKNGFQSQQAALAHAQRVEMALRLNRC